MYAGRIVAFERTGHAPRLPLAVYPQSLFEGMRGLLLTVAFLFMMLLAVRNPRLGRGDLSGALRVAVVALVVAGVLFFLFFCLASTLPLERKASVSRDYMPSGAGMEPNAQADYRDAEGAEYEEKMEEVDRERIAFDNSPVPTSGADIPQVGRSPAKKAKASDRRRRTAGDSGPPAPGDLAPGADLTRRDVMGGIDVIVPAHWRVEVMARTVMGGIGNITDPDRSRDDARLLLIDALAVMGGIEIHAEEAS